MANVSSFSGAMPVIPGGTVELGYAEITSSVTISSTTAGSGTTIFSDLSFVSDGSPILVELFSPQARPSLSANASITVSLYLDGSEHTRTWARHRTAAGTNGDNHPLHLSRRITPSAGSHTVSVKAYASTGSGSFGAGTGTSTTDAPAFLRVSKIVQQNDGLKPFWTPPVVTQLPSQATVGDQVIYAADATNGVYWSLYYDGIGTYPWKFVGGSGATTTTTAYPASSYPSSFTSLNSGPAWIPPLAGDYNVRHWGRIDIYSPTATRIVEICPATNTVAASSAYATAVGNWATSGSVYRSAWTGERLMQGMLSTEYLTLKAQYGVGQVTFVPFYCGMTATPVRVKAA